MKKIILGLLGFLLLIGVSAEANTTLKIGATAVPHAEILEFAKPLLKKEGINLKIITFQDYILPNKALASKDIDANYFQHVVYLDAQNKEYGYNFVNVGAIHIEPIGIYSKRFKSLSAVKKGTTVILSNSVADRGRALALLQNAGLIKLKAGINVINADISDITENRLNLTFRNDIDPALLPMVYSNDEAGLVVINTNYALEAGLKPSKDALFIEGAISPYVNIIAVRKGDENREDIKKLVKILQGKEVRKFIEDKYQGAVVPTK